MKKSLSQVLILSAALLLASCQKPTEGSSKPAETSEPETSVTESSTPASESTPTGTSTPTSTPTGTSTPASTPSSTPSSSTSEAAVAFTGIDIIEENNKIMAKITGTISGFANANAMKMAFGLVQSEVAGGATAQYILGSATPADADYKYTPTVNAGTFELKVDLSTVTWASGTYTAMCGPKGHYAAVGGQNATGISYGTGKAKTADFRISVRSHNGTIAADELQPIDMTISTVEVVTENEVTKVIHTIGGDLNTSKLSEADFLAKHPYIQYEHINDSLGSWKTNVMGSSTKTDLVTVAVENGKALIKTDITSLPLGGYNIKINLNADSDIDTKMDAIINGPSVTNGTTKYTPFADSTKSAEADLYGNCGIYITHEHAVTVGEKAEDSDLYPVGCSDHDFEGYELRLSTSVLGNDYKMNSKKSQTFNVTGIESGEYEVYFKCAVSSGNGGPEKEVGPATGEQLDDNGATAGGTAVPARYYVQAGTADPTYMDTGSKNFYECGIPETTRAWVEMPLVSSVMIKEGTTTFKVAHTGAGYSLYIEAVRLIRKGDYVAPPKPILAGTTPIRVECESVTVDGVSTATEGTATYLSQIGGWPAKSATYTVNIPEAQHVRFMLHARWTRAQFGNYGVAELYVDGASAKTKGVNDDNIGQDGKAPDSTWKNNYSVEFDLTAGDHTFKLQTPGGCTVDWDYFEIQQVAADVVEEPAHTHTWTEGNKVADVTPSTCECGDKMYTMLKADADGDNDVGLKLGKNTAKYSIYDITDAIPAGTYSLELYGHCTSGGNSASNGFSDKYKFFFGNDATTTDLIAVTSTDTYGAYGWENSSSTTAYDATLLKWTNKAVISEFVVPANATHLGIIFTGSGNSAFINGIRLVSHAAAAE